MSERRQFVEPFSDATESGQKSQGQLFLPSPRLDENDELAVCSGRGEKGTHRNEEWLHLWGDNIGGPSERRNFVAGSYAANTLMIAVEQALAENLPDTAGWKLQIIANCVEEDVARTITYEIFPPADMQGRRNIYNYMTYFDCDMRSCTKQMYDELHNWTNQWINNAKVPFRNS